MKYRFTEDDLIAGAMALGLISAGVQFKYLKFEGEHRLWTLGEVPESCQPEKWSELKAHFPEFKLAKDEQN